MKRLKQILAMAMVVMMGVVFMPMMPKMNGVAKAAEGAEFYAVYNTAAEGNKPANTLSFYYDDKKATHTESTKTVYDNLPTEATEAADWGYDSIRKPYNGGAVKNVVIDESVKDYKGLKSTAFMFADMQYADNISGCEYLDVSSVTDMSSMFKLYAYASTTITAVPNVSNWDTSSVEDMDYMFYAYGYFSTAITAVPNVSNWNTGSVKDMNSMFYNYATRSTAITAVPDVSKWDTSSVTNMNGLFRHYAYGSKTITAVPNVLNWDTSSVEDMSCLFQDYAKNSTAITAVPDVSKWDTSSVVNMLAMFNEYAYESTAISAVPDVSNWDTSSVKTMTHMFCDYAYESTVMSAVPDVSNWDTGSVEDMNSMFFYYGCNSTAITTAPNVSNWDTSSVKDMNSMFRAYASHSKVITDAPDVSNWDTSSVEDMGYLFHAYAFYGTTITEVPDVSNWDTSSVEDMSNLFDNYGYMSIAKTDVPDVSNWDTSSVTNMNSLFRHYGYNSTAITAVPDVSNWDTSNVKDMEYMFYEYAYLSQNKLEPLDLSGWDISALRDAEKWPYNKAASNMFTNYNASCSSGNPIVYATDWSTIKTAGVTAIDMFTGSKLKNYINVTAEEDQWSFANTGAEGCFTAAKYSIDFGNGKGFVKRASTASIANAAEQIEEKAPYDKELAGWAERIDETDETKLVATEDLESGKSYYAVWKNEDTGKTVVTKPLNLQESSGTTDELGTYGYKYEHKGASDPKLTLKDCTLDIHNVSDNQNAALQLNSNTEISIENNNVILANSAGNCAYGILSEGNEDTDRITIRKGFKPGSLIIRAKATGDDVTDTAAVNLDGPSLAVEDCAKVTAIAENADNSYGIRVNENSIISLNSSNVTAQGCTSAFSKASTFAKNITAKASTNINGRPSVDYVASDNSTYKWVRTYKKYDPELPIHKTKYTVTFDAQGHGTTPEAQKIAKGGKVKKPDDPVEKGYTFGGWFADKECTKAWDFDKDIVTKSITLYAKWTENTAIEDCDIVLSNEVYAFNNRVQVPNVTVTDPNGKILEEDKDYTFELEDSKDVGTYAVTVIGIGAYKGGGQASYKINPAAKAIKKVKAGKKKLIVKCKKSSKAYRAQTTKFQIRYSTSKSFKKSKTKTAYAKANATSKTIKGLKAHKKYYVKMRVIKIVGGQKYWSSWSKVKVKKTR